MPAAADQTPTAPKPIYSYDIPTMECKWHRPGQAKPLIVPLKLGKGCSFLQADFTSFPGGEVHQTELSNLMLHGRKQPSMKRPAAADTATSSKKMKRPAAAVAAPEVAPAVAAAEMSLSLRVWLLGMTMPS